MTPAIRDSGQILRSILLNPRTSLMPVWTLGLGMASAITIFSLMDWALIRPLPGINSQQGLTSISFTKGEGSYGSISFPVFEELARRSNAFQHLAASNPGRVTLAADESLPVQAELVSDEYFEALAATPDQGRGFTPQESRGPSRKVVVISHRLGQSAWASSRGVLGREVLLNSSPATVVGVAPKGFGGPFSPHRTQVWMPVSSFRITEPYMPPDSLHNPGTALFYTLVGRLAEGWSEDAARQEIDSILHSLNLDHLDGLQAEVIPGLRHSRWERDRLSRAFELLWGAVLLLMLAASVNAAGLMFNRNMARGAQMAIRRALGASRFDLLGLLVMESLAVCLAAAAIGLILSNWGFQWVSQLGLLGAFGEPATLDWSWRVAGFSLALALLTGLASGLVPAWIASGKDLAGSLCESSQRSSRKWRAHWVVVVFQIALSLCLLVAASLLWRTLSKLYSIDTGMRIDQVQAFTLAPQMHNYPMHKSQALYGHLIESLSGIQAIDRFSLAELIPFEGSIRIRNLTAAHKPQGEMIRAQRNSVTAGHFETLGIPILQGRAFQDLDGLRWKAGDPMVAVISQSLAQRLWPSGNGVLGSSIRPEGWDASLQVIGVAADHSPSSLGRKADLLYEPLGQGGAWPGRVSVLVRTQSPLFLVSALVKDRVRAFDPSLALDSINRLAALRDRQIAESILMARLLPAFALLALLLSSVGLYASVGWAVRQRRRAIGIRMSLGATPGAIGRFIGLQVATVTGMGLALGFGLSAAFTHRLSDWLYAVSPLDPTSFAVAGVTLLLFAIFAVWVPLRQAIRTDPAETLRCE